MGAISKAVNKIIPKEIRPILPFAASMFGGPIVGAGLGKLGVGSQFLGSALGKGLTGGITNIAAQALTGGKISPRSAILSGLMSGGGSFLRSPGGLAATKFGQKLAPNTLEALQGVGQVLDPAEVVDGTYSLTGTGEGLSPITRPGYAALTVGGAEAAYQTAEEEQRKFEEEQAARDASQQADMASRAEYLRNYAKIAGYSEEEINDLLDRYGYSGYRVGGRVGFSEGGGSLLDKATDMNILAMKIKLIDLGYGGFGGKDLDEMTDEEIMQMYESATSKANGGLMGTRAGFEIGGMSDLGKFFSKITGKKPTEESLMDLRSRYAKEIENQMISELDTDYPSVETLNQIRNEANRQADIALNNYMESLGMEPFNPPEGSIGADVIEQIMGPREEGRVMEANGGRIKKSIGGLAFAYSDYLRQADELGLSGDLMSFEDFTDTWLELQSDLGNTEKYKDGGMINMKMGGMPAEMDLRGGGFVPIGAKERADDVPARLSKNEFVMTADAVRAAGGGSVNKGAKRMYDLMNKLEARV